MADEVQRGIEGARERREPGISLTRAGPILAPLDGSEAALAALPVARGMAESEGSILHVVHVSEGAVPVAELMGRLHLTQDQVRGAVLESVRGRPADGIVALAEARRSSVIVMCTHTGILKGGHGLGMIAEEVLEATPCPVVFVRPDRGLVRWELNHVVLPHDGTPTTAAAIAPAVALAHRAGASLSVLYVTEPHARPTEPGSMGVPAYIDQPQHEWPAWAAEFVERLRALGHLPSSVKLRMHLGRGHPGREAVLFARKHLADLVVLAWHGDMSPEHGATVKAVIRSAPCPVLVIPFTLH